MRIPAGLVQEIKSRFDLVSYIHQHYTPLREEGALWVGLCPFHPESEPSFKVYPKGYRGQRYDTFCCFGCRAGSRGQSGGSDAIAFVQKAEALTFEQAVRKLASLVGLDLGERLKTSRLEELCRVYETHLTRSEAAQNYLASRGITLETARRFRVGYVPEEHPVDALRHRLAFPVTAGSGQVLGFAYRTLEEGRTPKYRLSRGLARDRVTFGLHVAWPAIRRARRVVLVEGPFDAMALHQQALGEAVSILGLRLPDLRGLCGKSIVWYLWLDGDEPGQQALRQACEVLLAWGEQRVHVVRSPGRMDPDEAVRMWEATALLEQAPPALTYFSSAVLERTAAEIDRLRARALRELASLRRGLPSTPEEQQVLDSRIRQALLIESGANSEVEAR